MSEKIPTNENPAEKIHTEQEVLNIFERIIDADFEILRSLEDEKGIYILEAKAIDEAGDTTLYSYIRSGKYPEGSSSETVIDVIYFEDGVPAGGHPVTKYIDGKWTEQLI